MVTGRLWRAVTVCPAGCGDAFCGLGRLARREVDRHQECRNGYLKPSKISKNSLGDISHDLQHAGQLRSVATNPAPRVSRNQRSAPVPQKSTESNASLTKSLKKAARNIRVSARSRCFSTEDFTKESDGTVAAAPQLATEAEGPKLPEPVLAFFLSKMTVLLDSPQLLAASSYIKQHPVSIGRPHSSS